MNPLVLKIITLKKYCMEILKDLIKYIACMLLVGSTYKLIDIILKL